MINGISIIICCYNSSSRIAETLRHIALQNVSSEMPWEIILVNNNSSDNTIDIAKKEWSKYSSLPPLKIITEETQGLHYARNKGIQEAVFELILFCDDDNWLESNYLKICYEIMSERKEIGVIGGWSNASATVEFPNWFSSFQSYYAVGAQALEDGDVSDRGYLWGAGMCIRKNIFKDVATLGFTFFLTGRSGSALTSGDDSEISQWARLLGYKLWYTDKLHFTHFISSDRLTKEYLQKIQEESIKSNYWLSKYEILNKIKKLKRTKRLNLIKGLKLFLKSKTIYWTKNQTLLTTAQFMVGSKIKISSKDDFEFIKVFEKALYID